MIVVLFYPEPLTPTPLSRVYRVLQEQMEMNDMIYHNNPKKYYDLHFFWSFTKYKINPSELTLIDKDVINRGCWDISKQKVNDVFNDISIDPTKHKGVCIEKREMQGGHKYHRLINCPAAKQEGYVYQRYIHDKEGGLFVKYRIYYADGIKYIIKQCKPDLFGSNYVKNDIIEKTKIFTLELESDLVNKCEKFGFDFGEVEFILENKQPIYIDINNCVGGGYVSGLSGTEIHRKVDNTLIEFIKNRYERKNKPNPVQP